MERITYIAASVIVLGGLLAASIMVHNDHVTHARQVAQTATQNVQHNLDIVKQVDAKNLSDVQAKAAADKAELCGFIASHVDIKKTPGPATCQ